MDELKDGAHASVTVIVDDDGVAVISIEGELDISNVAPIEEQCTPVVEKSSERVVFDLGSLRFIDSSGLAMLLRAAQTRAVEIRNPSPMIRRVITASGLTDVLRVEQ